MQFGTTLKTYCPPGTHRLLRTGKSRLLQTLSCWFPFVFPWNPLQRISGLIHSGPEITMAQGRVDGKHLHLESVVHRSSNDPIQDIKDLRLRNHGPVCVSLLRNRALVRHFRVPTTLETEIEAMLPHLLASELPQSISLFSWVWVLLPAQNLKEGFSQIAVYVIRNDRFEESLVPLVDAGLDIVGMVPEGCSWAHVIGNPLGTNHPPDDFGSRSILIRSARAHLLVVERDGQLLFDMILPLSACLESGKSSEGSCLDWDGAGFSEAREQFDSLLGYPLPQPKIWPDALHEDGDFDQDKFFFAGSVAASGLDPKRLLMPPKLKQRIQRRMLFGTLTKLGRLALLACLVWLTLLVSHDIQMRKHLVLLEQQIATDAPLVEDLEMEYNVIQESRNKRVDNTEILMVLDCLRLQVRAPIYLTHLNYVQGRGITLRGGAPASSNVLEMTEKLADDPLWQGFRVMQLQSEKQNGVGSMNFVVEGQLNQ